MVLQKTDEKIRAGLEFIRNLLAPLMDHDLRDSSYIGDPNPNHPEGMKPNRLIMSSPTIPSKIFVSDLS